MKPDELTERARNFAAEYLIDFKAGPAALRAGYETASVGSQLLQDPRIKALINEGKRKATDRVNISVDNTLEILRSIAQADITDVLKPLIIAGSDAAMVVSALESLPDYVRHAIKSVKWTKNGPEFVMHDKVQAVAMIGKYYGLFVEKHELSGPGGGPVQLINSEMSAKEAADLYAATLTGD